MPISAEAINQPVVEWRGHIDARWLMSYAAGLGLSDSEYLDTARDGGVVGHPMFPVAPEWQLLTDRDSRFGLGVTAAEGSRAVHASQDIVLHRPLRPDQDVTVTAAVVGVQRTSAGALVTIRLDGAGDDVPLWTSYTRSMYRGVEISGDDAVAPGAPVAITAPESPTTEPISDKLDLWRGAAHVYTECARIWNPIHTDVAVARSADLPDIILHGTATLAHGVSHALDVLGAGADRVRRVGGSFRAMILLPSTIERRVTAIETDGDRRIAHFDVLTASGEPALRSGFVVVD